MDSRSHGWTVLFAAFKTESLLGPGRRLGWRRVSVSRTWRTPAGLKHDNLLYLEFLFH